MSEKRFTIDYASLGIFDNKTQKAYKINPIFDNENLIDFMNELNDENEQLRKEKIEANAFIVENGLAEKFVKWTTCIVGENNE